MTINENFADKEDGHRERKEINEEEEVFDYYAKEIWTILVIKRPRNIII